MEKKDVVVDTTPKVDVLVEKKGPNKTSFIAIVAVFAALDAILGIFAVIIPSPIPGISGFYPAIAFETAVAIWLGGFGGLMVSVLACLVAYTVLGSWNIFGILTFISIPPIILIPWAFRKFNIDPSLTSAKGYAVFFGFSLIREVISGIAGSYGTLAMGWIPPEMFWISVVTWVVADMIVLATIGVVLLKLVTKYMKMFNLYVPGAW